MKKLLLALFVLAGLGFGVYETVDAVSRRDMFKKKAAKKAAAKAVAGSTTATPGAEGDAPEEPEVAAAPAAAPVPPPRTGTVAVPAPVAPPRQHLSPEENARQAAEGFLEDINDALEDERTTMDHTTFVNKADEILDEIRDGNYGFGLQRSKFKFSVVEPLLLDTLEKFKATGKEIWGKVGTNERKAMQDIMKKLAHQIKVKAHQRAGFEMQYNFWANQARNRDWRD